MDVFIGRISLVEILAQRLPQKGKKPILTHIRDRRKEQRTQKLREGVRQAVFSLYARGEYLLFV